MGGIKPSTSVVNIHRYYSLDSLRRKNVPIESKLVRSLQVELQISHGFCRRILEET